MLCRVRPLMPFFCSKRFLSHASLTSMMNEAARLERQKRYVDAQKRYKEIMDEFPNYEEPYKHYISLELEIGGMYALTRGLHDNLRKKFLDAVAKYGEFQQEPSRKPTPKR